MTSNRAKGQKHVNEAIHLFEELGFLCWKPGAKAHFIGPGRVVSQSQDIFEAFDFLATRRDSKLLLVQVTTIKKGDGTGTATTRRKKAEQVPLPLQHTVPIVLGREHGKKWTAWLQLIYSGTVSYWKRIQLNNANEFKATFSYPLIWQEA